MGGRKFCPQSCFVPLPPTTYLHTQVTFLDIPMSQAVKLSKLQNEYQQSAKRKLNLGEFSLRQLLFSTKPNNAMYSDEQFCDSFGFFWIQDSLMFSGILDSLIFLGIIWDCFECSYMLLNLLRFYGILWICMKFYEILWHYYMGFYGKAIGLF